jgi:hypothetical protein
VPVSPGHAQRFVAIQGSCPTFSWDAVPGARGHELLIYRVDERGGAEPEPVQTLELPGSASSWTPSLDGCLARGQAYAWAVRSLGPKQSSDWSESRLFRVAPEPSEEELRQALELVRTYAAARLPEAGSETDDPVSAAGAADPDEGGHRSSPEDPAPQALGGSDFSVDGSGNVQAASFAGDGSALTALDWDHLVNLPPGFADGIDNNTTYSGSSPITVGGSTIGLSTAGCVAGEIWKWTGSAWSCVGDHNTTYSAGTGLGLAGTTFSIDSAIVARKDGAAGNQAFDTNTLFLDYANNRVGVKTGLPDEELDVVGDVEVSGQYYYSVPRTFYQYIGTEEFIARTDVIDTFFQSSGYKYPLATTPQWAFAPVNLPGRADVTEVRCYYIDDSTGADIASIEFWFWARPITGMTHYLLGYAATSSTGDSSAVANFADTVITGDDPIANGSYVYWIDFGMDLTAASTPTHRVNFRGCRITYTLERVSF